MQTYDLDQTAELIEAMRPTRMFVPTLLAVLCGMRRGEVAALRWQNVDLVAGRLAVVESAEQVGQHQDWARKVADTSLPASASMIYAMLMQRIC
jgi:integrase